MQRMAWFTVVGILVSSACAGELSGPDAAGSLEDRLRQQAALIEKLKAENAALKKRVDELTGKSSPASDRPVAKPEPEKTDAGRGGAPAPSKPRKVVRKTSFGSEKTVRRDWVLKGPWRLNEGGLFLTGGNATMLSTHSYVGDATIRISYDMTPRTELWVTAWGERFVLKGTGKNTAMIQRKGNTVRYACGKAKPAGVKLKDSQIKKPSRILIHLDRLNLWRPKMTLLVRGISVEGLEMPEPAP